MQWIDNKITWHCAVVLVNSFVIWTEQNEWNSVLSEWTDSVEKSVNLISGKEFSHKLHDLVWLRLNLC